MSIDPDKFISTESFLSRWSRRKLEAGGVNPDRRQTGLDDLSDSGDGSVDKASDAIINDAATLREFFLQTEFRQTDGLNEYDENYTFFTPRGGLITREMRRAWEKLDETLLADSESADGQSVENEHPVDTGKA